MLTPRQREIALLVSAGLTNREIAARLFLSPGTVRNAVSVCLAELQLSNRSQLTAWALKNNLSKAISSPQPSYDPDCYRDMAQLAYQ